MEFYTLEKSFLPRRLINQFVSAIWTERYSAAGDFELVVLASNANVQELSVGRFVALDGTKEVMIIESQSIEEKLLTVKGSSLVKFLNEREAWFPNFDYDGTDTSVSKVEDYSNEFQKVGDFLATVLEIVITNPPTHATLWASINLDNDNDPLTSIEQGHIATAGSIKPLSFPIGPFYDGLAQIASAEGLGFKLYLDSVNITSGDYVLKFATYFGRNRTSNQDVNRVIRMTPFMDSLLGVKELVSSSGYKNVCYVFYKNEISVHYAHPSLPIPKGFDRRVIKVDAPDIHVSSSHVDAFRARVARNAFAANNFTKAVDGQVSTRSGYRFQTDYDLGDIVEVEGYTGLRCKARVSEYIRSQDSTGYRAYPTLDDIDPLQLGYFPDVEDDDGDRPWKSKPKYHESETYIVVGYYPDQDGDEVLGAVNTDNTLSTLWIYQSADDPDVTHFTQELIPLGWAADKSKVIVQSVDGKTYSDDVPWTQGYAYWLVKKDGTDKVKATDTIPQARVLDAASGKHTNLDPQSSREFWCGSEDDKHLYVNGIRSEFADNEYVYADGTYSDDSSLTGHGLLLNDSAKTAIDTYHSATGLRLDLVKILDPSDFPTHMRWNSPILRTAPDGSKLLVQRAPIRPGNGNWSVRRYGTLSGYATANFRIQVGKFGDLDGIWTDYIPFQATGEQVWDAIFAAGKTAWESATGTPILDDPRDYGYSYTPYAGNLTAPYWNVSVSFQVLAPEGIWLNLDNWDPINGVMVDAYILGAPMPFGPPKHYLCNPDGSDLTALDFGGAKLSYLKGWTPDSSKLHGIAADSGHEYAKMFMYEVSDGTIAYPLDYSSDISSYGYGPLRNVWVSPNSAKMVWMLDHDDGSRALWVGNIDGSGSEELYAQAADLDDSDQDSPFVGNYLSWSWDSKKIAISDPRDASPVWVINVETGAITKAWGGVGWTDPDAQKWVYDVVNFDG